MNKYYRVKYNRVKKAANYMSINEIMDQILSDIQCLVLQDYAYLVLCRAHL